VIEMSTGPRDTAGSDSLRRQLSNASSVDDRSGARAEPFDVLLADAALGSYRRFVPGMAGVRLGLGLARRPAVVARRAGALAVEYGRIALGTTCVRPAPRDRRFADPGWADNPLLRRLAQTYVASSATAQALVADANLDPASAQRIEFIIENAIQALAPSNLPFANPQALKAAVDSAGMNYVRGTRNFLKDMSAPPRIPAMVDRSAYRVGDSVAMPPGAVVLRSELFELIQYAPQTERVLRTPLLLAPPMINKFYVMDLAPGRSMVEYLIQHGMQVFIISWRNPEPEHSEWGFDAYAQGILEALDAVQRVTGSEQAVLYGGCSGGIVSSMTASQPGNAG
jgi:polyhydroxyalkanoate synthase